MLFVVDGFSGLVSSVVDFLEDVPCNFLLTFFASAMTNASAPETAKALMIFVANGFRFAKVFLRSLVALSNAVFCVLLELSLS